MRHGRYWEVHPLRVCCSFSVRRTAGGRSSCVVCGGTASRTPHGKAAAKHPGRAVGSWVYACVENASAPRCVPQDPCPTHPARAACRPGSGLPPPAAGTDPGGGAGPAAAGTGTSRRALARGGHRPGAGGPAMADADPQWRARARSGGHERGRGGPAVAGTGTSRRALARGGHRPGAGGPAMADADPQWRTRTRSGGHEPAGTGWGGHGPGTSTGQGRAQAGGGHSPGTGGSGARGPLAFRGAVRVSHAPGPPALRRGTPPRPTGPHGAASRRPPGGAPAAGGRIRDVHRPFTGTAPTAGHPGLCFYIRVDERRYGASESVSDRLVGLASYRP